MIEDMIQLDSPIADLKGFGPKSAEKFTKLDLHTVGDLLLYFPFRYEDFKSKSIFELMDGEKAVITGTVVTPANVQYYGFKRNRLSFKIKQGEAVIAISFFNQPYLVDKIEMGAEVAIFGKWDQKKSAVTGMKVLAQVEDDMQPVYHVAQGVSQAQLIKAIRAAFDSGALNLLEESLPQVLMDKYRLMGRQEAVRAMHFPKDLAEYKQALRRTKFEELFYFQMNLQVLKAENKSETNGLAIAYDEVKIKAKIAELPFPLTEAQQRSLSEILADMKSGAHMNRLLQGDVGSGKTVIASLAMYGAYTAGLQSALMVPTEILAEQHYQSFQGLFPELEVALLTSGMKAADKKVALSKIESGEAQMIVGTHSLIQDTVTYHRLGLVITDEQHRFGVRQREKLMEKGDTPHVLAMSATPIPRTLALVLYGDMDLSIMDELPANRLPIKNCVVGTDYRPQAYRFMKDQIEKGRQVYIICPMVEEKEEVALESVVMYSEQLKEIFPAGITIECLHGKMKPKEKNEVMQRFIEGTTDILVSTTVIEVGIDVPNATVMMIENAERFGLAQLHQLRGRVGRGKEQSYCILMYGKESKEGKERLSILAGSNDGFEIAREDLKLRGQGDFFGVMQSGDKLFSLADIYEDAPVLKAANEEAKNYAFDEITMFYKKNRRLVEKLNSYMGNVSL